MACFVVFWALTVLKVLEALILDFELERIDEQRRIIKHIHRRDIDGGHAALSGPASLKTFDGTGSGRAQCHFCCPASHYVHRKGLL